jgi:ribulose-5-phosphate 4-epimerase/fuculose-1-phosphate aldolase
MIDEGYTKFNVDWFDRSPIDHPETAELERWRLPLVEAGLVGHYPDLNIGYGNLSVRVKGGGLFVISGTQTGHLRHTDRHHYALVTGVNIDENSVTCVGGTQASSETLTHAAIYELDLSINAVVHVHSAMLWERLKHAVPTTDADVAYGTPDMADEFRRLYRETSLPRTGVAVMAGHESGLVSLGRNLEEAALRILSLHSEYERSASAPRGTQ